MRPESSLEFRSPNESLLTEIFGLTPCESPAGEARQVHSLVRRRFVIFGIEIHLPRISPASLRRFQ